MIPKLTVYAKILLYLLMVLIVEINCFSHNVQLQSRCSSKFVRFENDRVIANENSEYPQNITLSSYTEGDDQLDVRIIFYIKEKESYICFNKHFRPKLSKKLVKEFCVFKEEMEDGHFQYRLASPKHPDMYLGFNRMGKPFNYEKQQKIDKLCRQLSKRIHENSSNGPAVPTIDYEATTALTSSIPQHRQKSTRIHQRTHSNKIETSKSRNVSQTPLKRRKQQLLKQQSQSQQPHHVRHHHDQQPLRHYHTISHKDNKNIDSNSSTKQLGNEDLNAIYNRNGSNDSDVNIESENKVNRHVKKPNKGVVVDSRNSNNDNLENNNDTNNCTDDADDKVRKIAKGRNAAHANDKPNNKCNNNNRRHRKNNENGRQSRRPSQKSSSHKHPQAREASAA